MKHVLLLFVAVMFTACGAAQIEQLETAQPHVECMADCLQCLTAHADALDEPLAAIMDPCVLNCALCAEDALETFGELIDAETDDSSPEAL